MARWEGLNDIFKFESSEEGITITEYVGKATDVIVPAEINDQPVIAVKEGAFVNNSSITSVVFDGTFENYTEKMFAGCSSLKSLTISGVFDKALWWLFGDSASSVPASFTEISFALNSNYTDGYMFKGGNWENNRLCEHAITYVIPYGATKIYDKQFSSWYSLQSIDIPNSVTSIGDYAFSGCSGLISVSIPSIVTNIGKRAFWCCNSITCVEIPSNVVSIGDEVFKSCSSLTSVVISNGATSIGAGMFSGCNSLVSVAIPNSITSVGGYAFSNCSEGLYTEVCGVVYVDNWVIGVVNKTITAANITLKSRGIAGNAFSGCSSLMSVTIPDSVTSIGYYAFSGCSSLTSIEIPNSVTSIEYRVFNGCSNLTRVTFNGCVAQWKTVKKGLKYLNTTQVTVIKCSDGDVAV